AGGTVTYQFYTTLDGTGSHTDSVVNVSNGVVPNSSTQSSLAAGNYSYVAVYSGDNDNLGFTSAVEPLVVSQATPIFFTTPNVTPATPGPSSVTLSASASLTGTNPTGSITFTLVYNGGTVYTNTVTVTGNNTYNSGNYTLPTDGTTVTGTYQ